MHQPAVLRVRRAVGDRPRGRKGPEGRGKGTGLDISNVRKRMCKSPWQVITIAGSGDG